VRSLTRDEFSRNLPKPLKFAQQILPASSAMHRLEQSRVNLKVVLQQPHRFEYLLGGDRAEQIHQLHPAAQPALELLLR
jgi:hypothetical protein